MKRSLERVWRNRCTSAAIKRLRLRWKKFGDFECPSCAKLATFLDQLIKEYHPRVRLIFRNFPLPTHQFAREAALATEAAGLQGRFWEMHDMLFRKQAVWRSATEAGMLFDTYAKTIGLDLDRFRKDVESDIVRERIDPIKPAPGRWESKSPRHSLSISAKWDRMIAPLRECADWSIKR
jgi:predicted DsbA family dithiol-disulfide isomerase